MKKIIMCIWLLIASGLFFEKETVSASQGASFSVQAIIPERQTARVSYFDLTLAEDEVIELAVEIFNESSKEITVVSELNRATTSSVGNIQYMPTKEKDSSLQMDIEELVIKAAEKVTLQAQESKIVTWQIKMPSERLDGILLGGVRFSLEDEEEQQPGLTNRFAYTIGVVLRNQEVPVPVDLNMLEVKPGQVNYRNHVLVGLQNPAPRIVDTLQVQASVYKKGKKEPLYTSLNEKLRMAPHSTFDYAISTNEGSFKPGTYVLDLVAVADNETFSWQKEFVIKREESKQLNNEAILAQPKSINLWKWLAIMLLAVIVGGMVWQTRLKKGRGT